MFGPYGDYLIAAYGVVAVSLAILIAWITVEGRRLRARLDRIEAQRRHQWE